MFVSHSIFDTFFPVDEINLGFKSFCFKDIP
uniref:Uncharacterized protein n=1 Tax=viral metagenome TaxID=1070528 RepID=A0A6C0HHV9_9ZZZZ